MKFVTFVNSFYLTLSMLCYRVGVNFSVKTFEKGYWNTMVVCAKERVYEADGGLIAASWSATHWMTVCGSSVKLLSMVASPSKLSARSLLWSPA